MGRGIGFSPPGEERLAGARKCQPKTLYGGSRKHERNTTNRSPQESPLARPGLQMQCAKKTPKFVSGYPTPQPRSLRWLMDYGDGVCTAPQPVCHSDSRKFDAICVRAKAVPDCDPSQNVNTSPSDFQHSTASPPPGDHCSQSLGGHEAQLTGPPDARSAGGVHPHHVPGGGPLGTREGNRTMHLFKEPGGGVAGLGLEIWAG